MTDVILETRNLKKSFGKLEVLKGISTGIRRGEVVSIIGPSGGGKSTLCKLIPRFYDVTDGDIRIDGQDVRHVTQRSLRQQVGVVQQDVFLFAASILENIRYGKPGASEEEVARAAEEMGMNLSTAKSRLRRGRERLKEALRKAGYDVEEN